MSTIDPGGTPNTCFLFNIIATRLTLFKDKADDPKAFGMAVKFNNMNIQVTSSRMNVSQFNAQRYAQIITKANILRESMEADGITIAVKYAGMTMGAAKGTFPQSFLELIKEGMNDAYHNDTLELIRRGSVVGSLDISCFLTIKCEEEVRPGFDGLCDVSCKNLSKAINPADIMFVVGKPDICPMVCQPCDDDEPPEEGDMQLKLDLARYPTINRRVKEPPESICGMETCCELKAATEQYGEIIDRIVKKICQMPSPMPDDTLVTDWSGKRTVFKNRGTENMYIKPSEKIDNMDVKPIRFCPSCLASMSWLDECAPCPNCGVVPRPFLGELPENGATADQIIKETLRGPSQIVDDETGCQQAEKSEKKKTICCKCNEGELCRHCRIRNLCGDIFQPPVDIFKRECPNVVPKENEDFCIVDNRDMHPVECIPNLAWALDELQGLYKKREDDIIQEKLNLIAQTNLDGKVPAIAPKTIGSPSFMHREVPPKIGHKTCTVRQSSVSKHHGWAWKATKKARKHGWRPGAICRYVGAVMKFFMHYTATKSASPCDQLEEGGVKPILSIRKKNGSVYITLRAVNTPNLAMNPIVFKIVKSDLAIAMREIKRALKIQGFPKCTCHQSVMMCVCRKMVEKKYLEDALQKQCQRHCIENCVDKLILTDTSDSDTELHLDVSPPVATARPVLAIKPRTVNRCLQTDKKIVPFRPLYPVAFDPYYRAYNCATGKEYTSTAFGAPAENVFEDGLFGTMGGGPHGDSTAPGCERMVNRKCKAASGGIMRGRGHSEGGPFGPLGKSFPGAKKEQTTKSSQPIPVRMLKRDIDAKKKAIQDEKDAVTNEIARRAKGVDLMKYLMKSGTIPTPWNPNEPKPEVKVKAGPILGPDGLTNAQRKRRSLNQVSIPPLETLARLGKGFDPCMGHCYPQCAGMWCDPCCYYC